MPFAVILVHECCTVCQQHSHEWKFFLNLLKKINMFVDNFPGSSIKANGHITWNELLQTTCISEIGNITWTHLFQTTCKPRFLMSGTLSFSHNSQNMIYFVTKFGMH